jgi:hypothetical protein
MPLSESPAPLAAEANPLASPLIAMVRDFDAIGTVSYGLFKLG